VYRPRPGALAVVAGGMHLPIFERSPGPFSCGRLPSPGRWRRDRQRPPGVPWWCWLDDRRAPYLPQRTDQSPPGAHLILMSPTRTLHRSTTRGTSRRIRRWSITLKLGPLAVIRPTSTTCTRRHGRRTQGRGGTRATTCDNAENSSNKGSPDRRLSTFFKTTSGGLKLTFTLTPLTRVSSTT